MSTRSRVFTAAMALMLVAGATCSESRAQQPTGFTVEPLPDQTVILGLGISRRIVTPRPFKTVQITKPEIVDAVAQTDRRLILEGKAIGATTVYILDENNREIAEMIVEVVESALNRVEVHNKAQLTSATIFRCASTGCAYVDELTVKEPARLPPAVTETRTREERVIIRREQ